METYTVSDLRNRTDDLIRAAEAGKLSVITKHGRPVLVAVPFDELMLTEGAGVAIAIHLFDEERISLSRAARMAGRSVGEMIDLLGSYGIPVIRSTAEELKQELENFE